MARFIPSEDFPCPTAASRHRDRCPLAVPPSTPRTDLLQAAALCSIQMAANLEALLHRPVRCTASTLPPKPCPVLPWALFPSKVLSRLTLPRTSHTEVRSSAESSAAVAAHRSEPRPPLQTPSFRGPPKCAPFTGPPKHPAVKMTAVCPCALWLASLRLPPALAATPKCRCLHRSVLQRPHRQPIGFSLALTWASLTAAPKRINQPPRGNRPNTNVLNRHTPRRSTVCR